MSLTESGSIHLPEPHHSGKNRLRFGQIASTHQKRGDQGAGKTLEARLQYGV